GALLTLAAALALAACAPRPLPRGGASRASGADGGIPLRVMTYNIRSGNGDLAGTAAAIRAQAPDLVALQEVDVHWAERSGFADQATELGQRLGMPVRFARIYQLPAATPGAPPREFGVALLSRFPFLAFHDDTLTRLSTQDSNPVPRPMPGLLDAVVNVRGTAVRVFDTHLDYRRDPRVRMTQVAEMLARLGDLSQPTLVFGDLNAAPDAPELQPLLARLHDAWSVDTAPGFTYPADAPRERIDYVLVSPQFSVRSARVPETQASDHRPVVVELVLEARSSS
ncbi:MAG TPA: endonuclease/exonuclease/phosphatase family protein, partial [Gemmatimonadaceae bacterium]|nr:endonuclease/exonuclease/phosphatase family protein [Gemmatimonadaceae bacterium]